MKKTITAIALLAGAASGYSQGYFIANNFSTGYKQPIYNVQALASDNATVTYNGYTVSEEQGSTSTATPSGGAQAVTYTGTGLQDTAVGIGYSAQILAAPGSGDALSALSLVGTVINFSTASAGAGYFSAAQTITVPNDGSATTASVAIAAWNNENGTVLTLAAAQLAGDPWGISSIANIPLEFNPTPAAGMAGGTDLNTSFSLGTPVSASPEPSTIALGVIGASTLLFRRRK
jgi:hypothetical protein